MSFVNLVTSVQKISRRIYNLALIPFVFKNWVQVMKYVLFIINEQHPKSAIYGTVVLRGGQRLKIRLNNIFDVGSILESYGAEYDVLINTSKEDLQCIMAIAMEFHILDGKKSLSKLADYLSMVGFTVATTKINAHNICYLYAKRC